MKLVMNNPFGGREAAILDLAEFGGSFTWDSVQGRFPYIDCMRWWCKEPVKAWSLSSLNIEQPVSLFDQVRAAVKSIDFSDTGTSGSKQCLLLGCVYAAPLALIRSPEFKQRVYIQGLSSPFSTTSSVSGTIFLLDSKCCSSHASASAMGICDT
jgi:hypothetical protein